jgi:hypothetical protein
VGRLTATTGYIKSLALDLSARYDADGQMTESVADLDRHSAAATITARSAPKSKPAPAQETKPKPPASAVPPPAAGAGGPAKRETIHLKSTLSVSEIERRKAALTAAK